MLAVFHQFKLDPSPVGFKTVKWVEAHTRLRLPVPAASLEAMKVPARVAQLLMEFPKTQKMALLQVAVQAPASK